MPRVGKLEVLVKQVDQRAESSEHRAAAAARAAADADARATSAAEAESEATQRVAVAEEAAAQHRAIVFRRASKWQTMVSVRLLLSASPRHMALGMWPLGLAASGPSGMSCEGVPVDAGAAGSLRSTRLACAAGRGLAGLI